MVSDCKYSESYLFFLLKIINLYPFAMKAMRVIPVLAIGVLAASCSTTRVLADGEYRLERNRVTVTGEGKLDASELNAYIQQKPEFSIGGFNPLVSLYNWGGRDGGGFWKRMGMAPTVYDAALMRQSVTGMENHLRYIGYYGSTVTGEVVTKGRRVTVVYRVHLGRRYPIRSVRYEVPERGMFGADFLKTLPDVSVKEGMYLSEALLEKESTRSATQMHDFGYYTIGKNNYFFEADTLSVPGTAALTMAVREYTRNESEEQAEPIRRFRFGEVTLSIEENLAFRERVLADLNTVRPGRTYRERTVSNTYARLASLPVFSSVNVEMTRADTARVDCNINLTHGQLQGFKVNLEASVNSTGLLGVSPQLTYFHKNIFHGGERLNLGFMGNFQLMPGTDTRATELGASVSLVFPKLLGVSAARFRGPSVPRTDIGAAYSYQDRPEYTRSILSLSYGFSGNVRNRLFYQVYPLQASMVRISNMDTDFMISILDDPYMWNAYSSHLDAGLGSMLYWTTDNDAVPRSDYRYARVYFDISGNVLGLFKGLMPTDETGRRLLLQTPYAQYVRLEAHIGRTFFLDGNGRRSIALRVLGGLGHAYGNSDVLPYEKQFYAGGANSLRGWQARSVGPGTAPMADYFRIASQTGNMKLEANVEYRFPLLWKLQGAVFVDAGNVWDIGAYADGKERFHLSDLGQAVALDGGLGLRVDLSFILLRVDAGVQLHDPSRTGQPYFIPVREWLPDKHYALHFGVGYPF